MISKLKIYTILCIPLWLFFQGWVSIKTNDLVKVNHTVTINHPGEYMPVEVILTELQNKEGLPVEYYLDVESVICLEKVCKVIPVRIYWNSIGVYQRYELEKGATLEKYEADYFEPEDYKKLHTILANIDSPFKEVYLDEVLTVPDEHGNEDVDAVSGATALELDEKDTVPGAALTCYTLWHWVNGDVINLIKDNTAKVVSNKQLLAFLSYENEAYYLMALEELVKRKVYKKQFIDVIVNRVINDASLLRKSFKYLKTAPSEVYFSAVKIIFLKGNQKQKVAAIKSLQYSNKTISKNYLDAFSVDISNLKSFQEVSAFLELMQSKNSNSAKIIDSVMPLLEADFIIARRVYWFLAHEKLNQSQEKKIAAFHEKYQDRL